MGCIGVSGFPRVQRRALTKSKIQSVSGDEANKPLPVNRDAGQPRLNVPKTSGHVQFVERSQLGISHLSSVFPSPTNDVIEQLRARAARDGPATIQQTSPEPDTGTGE